LDIPFICWFRSSPSSSEFSGVFIVEEVDVAADKESGDTTVADVQTHLGIILNMFLRFARFTDKAFLPSKIKTSALETTLCKCWIIRVSKVSNSGLKKFCYIFLYRGLVC
jgi:hypothetical protein